MKADDQTPDPTTPPPEWPLAGLSGASCSAPSFDLGTEWKCERCHKVVPLGQTAIDNDTLEIICDECHDA